jgi:hypothetical protein
MNYYTKGKHGADSDWSQVEFTAGVLWDEQRGKFINMTYLIPGLGGLEMEEMATMLADRVERSHPGKGQEAFESGRMQLLNRDYNGEWEDLCRKIKVHKMWGGAVPAAILLPNANGDEWELKLTDKNGVPQTYSIEQKSVEGMELPNSDNARKTDRGWEYKPTPQQTHVRRELRRKTKARIRQAANAT